MSKYTTELRFICESLAGKKESTGGIGVKEVIRAARPLIFDFDYPVVHESYKEPLETKILRHFYTREIGFETYGRFKLALETKLNEIMPYYNQLYESELLNFNPLYDTDITTTHTGSGSQTSSGTVSGSGTNNYTDTSKGTSHGTDTGAVTRTDTGDITKTDTGNVTRTDTGNVTRTDTGTLTTAFTHSADNQHAIDYERDLSDAQTHTNDEHLIAKDTTTSSREDLYSDTPQGDVTGVLNKNYLTNARVVTDSTTVDKNDSTVTSGTDTIHYTGRYDQNESVLEKTTDNTTDTHNLSNKDVQDLTGKEVRNLTGNETRDLTDKEVRDLETNSNTTGELKHIGDTSKTESHTGSLELENEFEERVFGKKSGESYSKRLAEYRKTFLNIDMMVIRDLEELFLQLW